MLPNRALGSIALAGLALACAGSDASTGTAVSPTGIERLPIVGGAKDTLPAHDAVVFIRAQASAGAYGCTGTVIAPKVVLTAGHCTWDPMAGKGIDSPSAYTIVFGQRVASPTLTTQVTEVRRHPSFVYPTDNDLAILKIEDQPSGLVPIPALPASLGLTDGDQGAAVDIIGCGLTDPSNTSSFGTRMHISETISAVAGADGCSSANASVTAWSICYDVSAGGPAQADSGGPALLVRSGTTYVAAVTSGNVHGTKVGVSTRVDHFYESFISLKANGDACVAGAECQSGSCASSVCCDTPCGACHVCSIAAGASQDGHCEARSGGSCDDGNPCTVNDTCTSGSCAGTPKCGAGPCRLAGTCDPTTGECVPGAALADGTPCDDQDPCTLGDSCVSGECTGTPKDCAGKCRTASACDHATGNCLGISPDGTSCDDGNGCTQGDSCQAGACIAGAAVNTCPAPDACHDGSSCEPATGQCTPFPAKADGAKCEAGTCRGGVCVPSTRVGCSAAGSGQTMLLGAALGAFGLLRRRRTAGLQCLRR